MNLINVKLEAFKLSKGNLMGTYCAQEGRNELPKIHSALVMRARF